MKQKILVIEDDPIIQAELVTLLEGNNYEALTITDFTAVVQTVKVFQPHLILLDIKLPQTNGFTICSQIRSFSNVPIIFVTSCRSEEHTSELQCTDYFCDKLHYRHGRVEQYYVGW